MDVGLGVENTPIADRCGQSTKKDSVLPDQFSLLARGVRRLVSRSFRSIYRPVPAALIGAALFTVPAHAQNTYTFSTAIDNGNTVSETVGGVEVTFAATFGGGDVDVNIVNGSGTGNLSGNVVIANGSPDLYTASFDDTVNLSSIDIAEQLSGVAISYTLTPVGGSNSPVVVSFASGDADYNTKTASLNWVGVTGFTVTSNPSSATSAIFDNFVTTAADTTPPTLSQVTAVTSPTSDSTPNYVFSTNETGTLSMGGSCGASSSATISSTGNQTITLTQTDNTTPLSDGTYSNCTVTVTDGAGNASSPLSISAFTIDTTAPTLSEVTAVTTPTSDATPNYVFSTNETGTLSMGGSCGTSSSTTISSTGNQTITLTQVDNATPLPDGTYSNCTVAVTDGAGNASSALALTAFEVDTTPSPTVTLSASPASISETGGSSTLTATLSSTASTDTTVTLGFSGTATGSGTDYAVTGGTITITAGSTTGTSTINASSDTIAEGDETVIVDIASVSGGDGAAESGTQQTTVTITDDDTASVTIADAFSNEDNGAVTFTATLDTDVAGGFTVDVSTADGTATTADSDYTAVSGQTLTFTGNASETQTFTVTPTADSTLEADEAVGISMGNLAGTSVPVDITDTATLTIGNDDSAAVTIADANGDEDAGAITLTATLSHAVQGGFTVDVSTADGTATTADSDYTAVSGQTLTFTGNAGETQTFTVTPTTDSTLEADETVGISMSNLAGTPLAVDITDTATLTINNDEADTTAPRVTSITRDTPAASPTDSDTLRWAVAFDETVTAVDVADFTVTGPSSAPTVTVTGSGQLYYVALSGGSLAGMNGTVTLSFSGSQNIADTSGNALTNTTPTGTNDNTYVLSNSVPPSFSLAFSPASVGVGATSTLTFTIDNSANAVSATSLGFTNNLPAGVTVAAAPSASTTCTGGTLTATASSGTISYTGGTVVAGATCTVSADVTPGSIGNFANTSGNLTSSLGNSGTASDTLTGADATAPTVTSVDLFTGTTSPTDADTVSWDVVFSEDLDPATLSGADFAVSGTTATPTVNRITDSRYEVALTGGDLADLNATVTLTLAAGATITDAAGNALVSLAVTGANNNAIVITNDTTPPDVTLSTAASEPVSGAFSVSISFTETVTGFSAADLVVGNGTVGSFSGSGDSYTASITPTDDGAVTIDIPAGAAQDGAGNDNTAATRLSVEHDGKGPDVTISSDASGSVSGAFSVTVRFTETVTDFVAGDITVGNGTLSNFSGSGASYTADITPASDGVVTVDVAAGVAQDSAGNGNTAADQLALTLDRTAPGASLSISGQGPVSGTFTLTVSFTEAVTGFALDDLSIENGSASDLAGADANYTVLITPAADGDVTVGLPAATVQDGAGNDNTAADPIVVSSDSTPPVLSIELPGDEAEGAFAVRFEFSETVSGFEAADIVVTNGVASEFADAGDGTYTATVTPEARGTVTLSVAADAATDAAGNGSAAAEASLEAVSRPVEVELDIPGDVTDVTDVSGQATITNPGTREVPFQVEIDAPWIGVDPLIGQIPPLGAVTLNIAVLESAATLEPGVYTGTVRVIDTAAGPVSAASASQGGGSPARPRATGLIVAIPITITIEESRGTVQLVSTTPGGVQSDATFAFASSDGDFDGLELATSGGRAASDPVEKQYGTYDVMQAVPEGWRIEDIACTGDTDGGSVIDLEAGRVDIDLDGGEAIVCTFQNTRDEEAVRLATMRAINNFMVRRADRILSGAPDLSRRMSSRNMSSPGHFSADVQGGRTTMSMSTSLSGVRNHVNQSRPQMPRAQDGETDATAFDVWIQADYSALSDDRDGADVSSDFGLVQLGADWRAGERTLVGVMVQRDWMEEVSAEIAESAGAIRGARVEGTGWMAGPYLIREIVEGAYLDVLVLWGQSDNTVDALGLYQDDFETTRMMIRANLTGEWRSDGWRIRPSAGLAHFEETQKAYRDTLGIAIPEQTIRVGRLEAGPELAYRFEGEHGWWEPGLSLSGVWDYDPADLMNEAGSRVSTGALRADAEITLRGQFGNGVLFAGTAHFDGLGDGDFSARGARVELSLPF